MTEAKQDEVKRTTAEDTAIRRLTGEIKSILDADVSRRYPINASETANRARLNPQITTLNMQILARALILLTLEENTYVDEKMITEAIGSPQKYAQTEIGHLKLLEPPSTSRVTSQQWRLAVFTYYVNAKTVSKRT